VDDTSTDGVTDLLSGYDGAAVIADVSGKVVTRTEKAAGLATILERSLVDGLNALVSKSATERVVVGDIFEIPTERGVVSLDVCAVPVQGGNGVGRTMVISRDLTMERNLRTALVESRQRYKDLVEINADFAWEVDDKGRFIFVSPKGALGFEAKDLVDKPAMNYVIDPESLSPLPFMAQRPLENIEVWMRSVDGTPVTLMITCRPLLDDEGTWFGVRGVCRDVTVERESEAALARLRRREQTLSYVVSAIRDELQPENMLETAATTSSRALGAAGARVFRVNDHGGMMVAAEYGNLDGIEALTEHMAALPADGDAVTLEIGDWSVICVTTGYRHSVNGAFALWRAKDRDPWDDDHRILLADIANQLGIANEQVSNHERILALSRTDSMTGLLNRRAFFEEELPRRIDRLLRNNQCSTLFYVDMDNFKLVNDVKGHQAGDEAIMVLRDILMELSRPGDVIARLGGDEFAMWLDNMTMDVTKTRANRIIDVSQRLRPYSGSQDKPLGVSVGVAHFDPKTGEPLSALVARADEAMYTVKRNNKGGYAIAEPPKNIQDPS